MPKAGKSWIFRFFRELIPRVDSELIFKGFLGWANPKSDFSGFLGWANPKGSYLDAGVVLLNWWNSLFGTLNTRLPPGALGGPSDVNAFITPL